MTTKTKDPTQPMREQASGYPDVDEGTACTQSSFKVGKKSFFFIGMQGGRYKAMFKLQKSMDEARALAKKDPDLYQSPAGTSGWVTARFTAEKPMPKRVWLSWLNESYALSGGGHSDLKGKKKKATTRKVAKKAIEKRATTKKLAKKKTSKRLRKKKASKKVQKKKATKKRSQPAD